MASETDFEFSNKAILMDALRDMLPQAAVYSMCILEHDEDQSLVLIRGSEQEPADLFPRGPWIDPCQASVDVFQGESPVRLPEPGSQLDVTPGSD